MAEVKNRFLAQAQEAEETAEVAATTELKTAWLKIAKNYRELAGRTHG